MEVLTVIVDCIWNWQLNFQPSNRPWFAGQVSLGPFLVCLRIYLSLVAIPPTRCHIRALAYLGVLIHGSEDF